MLIPKSESFILANTNVPHFFDPLYNPCIENKNKKNNIQSVGELKNAKIETQVHIYIYIYICTQEVIIYKLAANFWSPALPQRVEACATRLLLLLLTVSKEFISQSI